MSARRQGGSRDRRAQKLNPAIIHNPPIVRRIPLVEVTNCEGVELIHDLAMKIVEEVGCVFQDEESIGYWRQTGAEIDGNRVSIYLEVEGLGDYLPKYAGNLDIMTAAGLRTAEMIAEEISVGRFNPQPTAA